MEKMMLDIGDKFTYEENEIRYTITVTGIDTCDLIIHVNQWVKCACLARINVTDAQINKAKMLQTTTFFANKDKVPNFINLLVIYCVADSDMAVIYNKYNIPNITVRVDELDSEMVWLWEHSCFMNIYGEYAYEPRIKKVVK